MDTKKLLNHARRALGLVTNSPNSPERVMAVDELGHLLDELKRIEPPHDGEIRSQLKRYLEAWCQAEQHPIGSPKRARPVRDMEAVVERLRDWMAPGSRLALVQELHGLASDVVELGERITELAHATEPGGEPMEAPGGEEPHGSVTWTSRDVLCCARCGEDHEGLLVKPFARPSGEWTHWTICPETRAPILVKITGERRPPIQV